MFIHLAMAAGLLLLICGCALMLRHATRRLGEHRKARAARAREQALQDWVDEHL